MARCENHGLSPLLLRVIDSNEEEVKFELGEIVLNKIDSIFTSDKNLLHLESKIMNLLESFINGKRVEINDSIKPVFKIVSNHYLETLNA